ncbi:hypothetical protein [Rhodonellum sp.]|uniref:hypothetical protein n=1 Tax=Rhodonellum sp. TaxID=2231180 RepID=UPI002717A79A|nr:hypothetical protein [Rhodonellum sp.]MDO9554534.1 hypothetical protein [Rhodonellum sp.]
MATWVLNDETKINSYGFRLLNAGLDLERFKENPMMLAMHKDWDLNSVIGRWTNIRIEGNLLLADDEFDMEDPEAKKIAGKAARGFLKACSLGFLFLQENFIKAIDGVFDLVKSEAYEASVVVVGSNANAARLYASPGVLMNSDQIKLCIADLKKATLSVDTKQKPNSNKMEKFTLSGAALSVLLTTGLNNQDDAGAVNSSIAKLGADLKQAQDDLALAKTSIQTMKDAQLALAKKNATDLVDSAITAGKLTVDKKEQFVNLALNDFDLAISILGNMPGKQGLSVTGGNPHGHSDDPKDLEAFTKLPVSKQLAFKESNPEGYQSLFAK